MNQRSVMARVLRLARNRWSRHLERKGKEGRERKRRSVEYDAVKAERTRANQVVGELRLRTNCLGGLVQENVRLASVTIIKHHFIMNFLKLSVRFTTSSLGAFSKTCIRCISTDPEFVRPPGPISSWTLDERNAYRRWKYAADTDLRQKAMEFGKEYNKRPYVKHAKLQWAARWRAMPGNADIQSQYSRDRYANDPDYRTLVKERSTRWIAIPKNAKLALKRQKERYANDPEYRERVKQYYRERYWEKKFGYATSHRHEAQDNSDSQSKSKGPDAKS